jgi:hypothetical protein
MLVVGGQWPVAGACIYGLLTTHHRRLTADCGTCHILKFRLAEVTEMAESAIHVGNFANLWAFSDL